MRSTPTSAPAATAARTLGSELGITELELGDLAAAEGRRAEACQCYRRSAAVYGELAAHGAVRADHHQEAEKASRAAAACGL